MNNIKLEAKNGNEGIILSYLKEFASPALVERINNGNKTLAQCWKYITSEAKKKAKNGCACIEDSTVYGWAIHFFEEDSIKEGKNQVIADVKKTEVNKVEVKKEKPKVAAEPKKVMTQSSTMTRLTPKDAAAAVYHHFQEKKQNQEE